MLFLLLFGCASDCERQSSGPKRDTCLHQRAIAEGGVAPAELVRLAGLIEDPMVRDATVLTWVRDHRGAVQDADRSQICGLLRGQERNTCDRRLSAAHLNR